MGRKTILDYRRIAKINGFTWVGKELPNSTVEPTLWACANGHVWKARMQHIRIGKGCPYCYGNVKKVEGDYDELALQHGIVWRNDLAPYDGNTTTPTLWQLPNGVIFVDTYHNLANKIANDPPRRVADKPHFAMRRRASKEQIADGSWKEIWKSKKATKQKEMISD